jgi:glycosyltransferase involved in cell wall biosynthesis
MENVEVIYVKLDSNKLRRQIKFYKEYRRLICSGNISHIIIKYFRFCAIYKLLHLKSSIYVDIRTGYLYRNNLLRSLANLFIKIEAIFFNHILVLSESLSERLSLPVSKTTLVPLGSKEMSVRAKEFKEIKLLYIGVLSNRRITDTVTGIQQFLSKNDFKINLSYEIIGYGSENEEKELIELIGEYNLENRIKFHGRIFGDRLDYFFAKCNIGVAYVPMTHGYNVQPVTKIYEYLFAGMPVIATNTYENQRVISDSNGILISDNPFSFSEGLERLFSKRDYFDSEIIKMSAKEYSWEVIIDSKLRPLLV